MSAQAIAIHGHVYQPPRADPRVGEVPVEPSAAPFHDWNERITSECYRPNAFARIVDERGRVVRIVNNYSLMSFDLGPTLAHWLTRHAPDVHDRMVEGDREARTAIAHPYHHAILPLCDRRDALTELRWGLADFRARFGREPEGMWLPETGIDDRTLGMLADVGVGFTVVAPHQPSTPVPAGHVGRWVAPGGQSVALVVYDGPVSHDVAFGGALHDTAALVDRMVHGADRGLVVAATDAETFGHHHRFTERAIAHALGVVAPARGVFTGGLARLMQIAPVVPVAGALPTAWSCAHGLGRWREDCGCSTDGQAGWDQRWRGPLRAALTIWRDHAVEAFARLGGEVFHDPWAARDAYGSVLADPSCWDEFVERQVRPFASETVARALLESQQATLASFTSCAWFFADLARREVAIVLQEALRSMELLAPLGVDGGLEAGLARLGEARSHDPSLPTGRDVWEWATAPSLLAPVQHSTPAPLEVLLAQLVEAALAGDGQAIAQAADLASVLRDRGGSRGVDRAQEQVFDHLAVHPAAARALASLAEALHLAMPAVA